MTTGTTIWMITGTTEALKDVSLDFIDGADRSLDALNARAAQVRIRKNEITITFSSRNTEDWIVEAFSRRHPDITISAIWSATAGSASVVDTWRAGMQIT